MERIEIKYMPVDELLPYVNNPRKNDKAVEYVANSIREFGFKVPIVIDENNEVIAGHTRLKASKELGLTEVPVIVANDLSEEQVRAFRLADNKVGELAEWDMEMLDLEIYGLSLEMDKFGFESIEDDFSTDFSLPSNDGPKMRTITLNFSEEQFALVDECLSGIQLSPEDELSPNRNGNKMYKLVRQWKNAVLKN